MNIITVDQCQLVHEDFNTILQATLDFVISKGYSHYHKKRHTGLMRHLIIRQGVRTKDLLVNMAGAVVFSSIGYCFVKKKGKGKFAPRFIPRVLTEEDRVGSPETAEPKDMGAKI